MEKLKEQGCLWWALIGWWIAPILLIVWGIKTLAEKMAKTEAPEEPETETHVEVQKGCQNQERHQLAGVEYNAADIMALAKPNPDYQKTKAALQRERRILQTIGKYKWPLYEAELVPEPDNPHDPKAIQVLAGDFRIGYIKAGSCAHIHKLIREDRIEMVSLEIGGGPGKILVPDEDSAAERYDLEQSDTRIWAKVTLHLKPKE